MQYPSLTNEIKNLLKYSFLTFNPPIYSIMIIVAKISFFLCIIPQQTLTREYCINNLVRFQQQIENTWKFKNYPSLLTDVIKKMRVK